LVLAPDASFIAIAGAIADFCILLYDNKLDKILARLQGHMGRIMMMKLSQNNRMVSCSYDHKIIVWDLSNNTIIYRKDYNCELLVCSISADGTTIAVSTSENLVEVWNIDLDLLILSLIHDKGELGALTLTSDCKELIIGGGKDKQTEVWDLISRTLMYSIDGHGTITYCLFVNRSKTILISAGKDRFLKIWDFRTGHLLKEFESHLRVTRRIAAADDANIVISGGGWNSDYNIRIWDVNRSFGTINKSNQAASIIAVMHSEINDCIIGVNRKNVFSINTTGERKVLKDKLSIRLVDRLNNNLYFPLNNGTVSKYQKDSGSWVDLFHNKDVVSAILPLSEDDWVIGDIKGNIVYKKNNEIKSYSRLSEFRIWQILTSNNYLVILDDNNQFYFIHKVSGKIDHTFKHYARLTSNVIVLNEDICFGDALGNITKLNLTDNTLQEISKAHESEITSILFLEKNRRIISGCSTGYIKIWNPDMTFCLLEFKGHESSVNFLCTSIDPYFLSAGGSHYSDPGIIKSDVKDTSLKKWNTYTGECVGVYPSNELITSINTDKTGLIIIGLRNGLIHEFYDQIIQPS
jgi:WD40 repeat protein